jgi:hypothetical protein
LCSAIRLAAVRAVSLATARYTVRLQIRPMDMFDPFE